VIENDPQDPLPEPTWLWRRLYVYAVSIVFMVLIWVSVHQLAEAAMMEPSRGIGALLSALKWLILTLTCVITYYLVAPSAEQIVKMIQAARIIRTSMSEKPPSAPIPEYPPSGGSGAKEPAVAKREPPENAPWA
jgi:hypothetical protein